MRTKQSGPDLAVLFEIHTYSSCRSLVLRLRDRRKTEDKEVVLSGCGTEGQTEGAGRQ